MKTIVLGSQKGGSGKTTLAAHLAVELERTGRGPVVVMDTDPQGSLAAWWNDREATAPAFADCLVRDIRSRCAALAHEGYTWCVVDTPPSNSDINRLVIEVADLVVIPARPSPLDLAALGATVDLCKAASKPYAFIVNAVKPGTSITLQTVAALSVYGPVAPVLVGDRVAYASAMVDGRALQEVDPTSKGAGEISGILDFLLSRFPDFQKSKKEKARA